MRKLNYGPNQIPNVPCQIFPQKFMAQLDSGLHKDPQYVVAMEEERNDTFLVIFKHCACLLPKGNKLLLFSFAKLRWFFFSISLYSKLERGEMGSSINGETWNLWKLLSVQDLTVAVEVLVLGSITVQTQTFLHVQHMMVVVVRPLTSFSRTTVNPRFSANLIPIKSVFKYCVVRNAYHIM